MLIYLCNSNALEEVKGGAELFLDAADKQSGPPIYNPPDVRPINPCLTEEEGEDADDIGNPGIEDFGAHAANSGELIGSEAQG